MYQSKNNIKLTAATTLTRLQKQAVYRLRAESRTEFGEITQTLSVSVCSSNILPYFKIIGGLLTHELDLELSNPYMVYE